MLPDYIFVAVCPLHDLYAPSKKNAPQKSPSRRRQASFRIFTPLPRSRPPQGLPLDSDDCTFYALICEREAGGGGGGGSSGGGGGDGSGADEDGVLNLWARVAHAQYGHNVARALARGQPPDPEEYALVSVGAKGV